MERFWIQLLQFIEEGRVIPIVGRDLLVVDEEHPDVTLYTQLARRLAEYLEVDAAEGDERPTLNGVACRFLKRNGQWEDIYAALKTVMPDPDHLPVPRPLAKLAAIEPFTLFVTTTFDSLLERALNDARFGGRPHTQVVAYAMGKSNDLPEGFRRPSAPTVFHLLGKLSAVPDYAVTEEDTLEFVHSMQSDNRPHRLLDELSRGHLLIVGSGFPDWLARFFLRLAKQERLWIASGTTDVVADRSVNADGDLKAFLGHFSRRTRVFPGDPLSFVDQLHTRWTSRIAAPAAPLAASGEAEPAELKPGSVFLSYASEDTASVQGLNAALQRAGIPTWLDKRELRAGDPFAEKIEGYIENCSLFMPIISRASLTPRGRFFRTEWGWATEEKTRRPADQAFIVPVVIDDTPPTAEAVPKAIREVHWERAAGGDVSEDFVAHVLKLVRNYKKALAGAA